MHTKQAELACTNQPPSMHLLGLRAEIKAIYAHVRQELELLLEELSYVPGYVFMQNVSYVEFLDRVHDGEQKLRETGEWEVPHPWLNLFVPESRIFDFDAGVIKGILNNNSVAGIILFYPMNRNRYVFQLYFLQFFFSVLALLFTKKSVSK
jgi:Cytokinin dehydrogenase 1, FAD and cytokinin binding